MPNPSFLDQDRIAGPDSPTSDESFGDILSQYEQSHTHKPEKGEKGLEGTVISVTAESVFVDIGYKIEGVIPLAEFVKAGEPVKPGDKLSGVDQRARRGRILRALAHPCGTAEGLVVIREGLRG